MWFQDWMVAHWFLFGFHYVVWQVSQGVSEAVLLEASILSCVQFKDMYPSHWLLFMFFSFIIIHVIFELKLKIQLILSIKDIEWWNNLFFDLCVTRSKWSSAQSKQTIKIATCFDKKVFVMCCLRKDGSFAYMKRPITKVFYCIRLEVRRPHLLSRRASTVTAGEAEVSYAYIYISLFMMSDFAKLVGCQISPYTVWVISMYRKQLSQLCLIWSSILACSWCQT